MQTWPQLRSKFLKNKTEKNKTVFKKQRNYRVSLLRKEEKFPWKYRYFKHYLNKEFVKTAIHFFANEFKKQSKTIFTKDELTISIEKTAAEVLNTFFVYIKQFEYWNKNWLGNTTGTGETNHTQELKLLRSILKIRK